MSAELTLEVQQDELTKKMFQKYLDSLARYVDSPTEEGKILTKSYFEQYLSMLSGEF